MTKIVSTVTTRCLFLLTENQRSKNTSWQSFDSHPVAGQLLMAVVVAFPELVLAVEVCRGPGWAQMF